MSKFKEIKQGMAIEDIYALVKSNPAGAIFHCANSQSRNEVLNKIWKRKFVWITNGKLDFDPTQVMTFDAMNKCSILVKAVQEKFDAPDMSEMRKRESGFNFQNR